MDSVTGLTVFTRIAHERRGKCWGGLPPLPVQASGRAAITQAAEEGREVRLSSSERKRKSRVYTKTGDAGTSSLFTGERVSKDNAVFEALGTIDELVSFCGVAHASCLGNGLHAHLEQIIKVLMTIASHVATPKSSARASPRKLSRTRFGEAAARPHIKAVENWIDDATDALPDLRSFVLPLSGAADPACSALHVCRSVCRRCERRVLSLGSDVDPAAREYLNRLSDFFFVAARYAGDHSRRREAGRTDRGEICYNADEVARDAKSGLRLQRDSKRMPTPAGDGKARTALHFPGKDWRSAAIIIVAILIGFFYLSVQPTAAKCSADAFGRRDSQQPTLTWTAGRILERPGLGL